MRNRLTLKLIAIIIASITLIAAILIPIYIHIQPKIYINQEARNVSAFSQKIKNVKPFDRPTLQNFFHNSDVTYRVYIFDNQFEPIFTSFELGNNKRFVEKLFGDKIDRFSETSEPYYSRLDDESAIRLYTRCKVGENTYYIHIKNNLGGADDVFNLSNRILGYIVAGYIIICSVVLCLAISPSIKSLKKVTDVAKYISKSNLSVRYDGKIHKNEIGDLALSVNKMADTIQENINNLENYNFVLREDNRYMMEYEKSRRILLRNITHDLKTPLAVISSQVEMIRTCEEQKKKDYYYDSAIEEINKMSHMISEVLQMTIDERQIATKKSQHINASELITELCDNNNAYIKSYDLDLTKNISPDLELTTIKEYMEFVFRNYLTNAVQNADKKSSVIVSLKRIGNSVRLSIENTGKQIPDEMKDKIWTETFTTSTERNKNNGLGLYIVKEISLMEHTECGFTNTNSGVIFWFDFTDYGYNSTDAKN